MESSIMTDSLAVAEEEGELREAGYDDLAGYEVR